MLFILHSGRTLVLSDMRWQDFTILLLGIRTQYSWNLAKFDVEGRQAWFLMALAIAALGLVVFNLGLQIGGSSPGVPKKVSPNTSLPPTVLFFGKVAALILIVLGLMYYVYFADRVVKG